MYQKISLIIFLSVLLASTLIVRHYYLLKPKEPALVDRVPDGDFLIRANVLDLAAETSGMFHYNKVDFRDFLSKEFLLGQAKSYGLDFQKPVYGFANDNGSWGLIVHVSDSSEIGAGAERLKRLIEIKKGSVGGHVVYRWEEEEAYLAYGKDWLLVFKGDLFPTYLRRVSEAKLGDVSLLWNEFLAEPNFENKNLVISSSSKTMNEYGLEKAMFAHNVDSVSITLLSYLKGIKNFEFKQKEGGVALADNPGSNKYLNVHTVLNGFGKDKQNPLYVFLKKQSKKVSFPLDDFLKAWTGDLSMREGGVQIVKETFIESVMDENFEISEVVSVKEKKVKGFSIALSLNEHGTSLINKLFQKGILTRDGEKYRFLISPPLNMKRSGDYYMFYSGSAAPKLVPNTSNNGYLTYKGTPFTFELDTLNKNEARGKIEFPVQRLLRRNKFF